jgi:hypothetical protein
MDLRLATLKAGSFYLLHNISTRAGLWVGQAGPLPRALTSRGRQKGGHQPVTH